MVDERASASGRPHSEHDLELVASLLDDDLTGAEHEAAIRQIDECAECAKLEADLRALVSATVALATPERPRDFRLTAADAAALGEPVTAAAPGAASFAEPIAVATRLTADMPDTADTAVHKMHDTLLVASLADRTVAGSDRQRAEKLVATCGVCAALLADLLAIRTATVTLATPPRVDDYQLTPEDAARLHPVGWRRLVAAIGASRVGFTRPLAVGLTTLGLAGLLVATVPSVLTGTSALGPTAGEASAPQSNERAADSSAGAAAGGGSAGGAAAPEVGVAAPNVAANAAATPQSVFAPPASGEQSQVQAAAPTTGAVAASGAGLAPVAASSAPVAPSAAAPAVPVGSSPAESTAPGASAAAATAAPAGPGYNAAVASPRSTSGGAAASAAQPPLAGSKGAGTGGDQALAAPVANPLPSSKVAPESETLDEQRAAEGGPSLLVLVSAALLVAGLGLLIVQRLGRHPIE